MPFIGNKPSAVPLTSADIADGIITSAKIVDGTIVNADINASAAIASTKLSGVGGLTEVDQWRLNANFTISSAVDTDITTGFERNDSTGFGYIGTGMTQSSGIFTFPSTGYYFIQFNAVRSGDGTNYDNFPVCKISVTINNSSYSVVAIASATTRDPSGDTSISTSFIFDVTSTANCKVKFIGNPINGNGLVIKGDTAINKTHFNFIKLGET